MVKPVVENSQLSQLALKGYKSIAEMEIELRQINVLIGANGAGKSNFINFFKLINSILDERLQVAVGREGGADALLHFGRQTTEGISAKLWFANSSYEFSLTPSTDNRLMFEREAITHEGALESKTNGGHFESLYARVQERNAFSTHKTILSSVRKWRIHHFHDTGFNARVKQVHGINDNEYLREDARNLAAFLLRLQQNHENNYHRIVRTIQLVAPFFGNFHLRATANNPEKIQLEWTEKGQDEPFTASALSDGTLRFICLATVLLQPEEFMPATILIDEPELGLHPFAVNVLGGLMKSVAVRHQLIISTQSVELVNQFEPEDLVVVDKQGGTSVFNRPDPAMLTEWLEDYSLGELWNKNLLGGRPFSQVVPRSNGTPNGTTEGAP